MKTVKAPYQATLYDARTAEKLLTTGNPEEMYAFIINRNLDLSVLGVYLEADYSDKIPQEATVWLMQFARELKSLLKQPVPQPTADTCYLMYCLKTGDFLTSFTKAEQAASLLMELGLCLSEVAITVDDHESRKNRTSLLAMIAQQMRKQKGEDDPNVYRETEEPADLW